MKKEVQSVDDKEVDWGRTIRLAYENTLRNLGAYCRVQGMTQAQAQRALELSAISHNTQWITEEVDFFWLVFRNETSATFNMPSNYRELKRASKILMLGGLPQEQKT